MHFTLIQAPRISRFLLALALCKSLQTRAATRRGKSRVLAALLQSVKAAAMWQFGTESPNNSFKGMPLRGTP